MSYITYLRAGAASHSISRTKQSLIRFVSKRRTVAGAAASFAIRPPHSRMSQEAQSRLPVRQHMPVLSNSLQPGDGGASPRPGGRRWGGPVAVATSSSKTL
ncbi:unnamed protein product [Merluccius merluccius]